MAASVGDTIRDYHTHFIRSIEIRYERITGHQRVQHFLSRPSVKSFLKFYREKRVFDIFCRFLITSYFLNMAYYNLDIYYNYNPHGRESLDYFTLLRVPFALGYLFNYRPNITGTALCIFSAYDSFLNLSRQILHSHFALTELIVKKLAIFGSCLLLVVELFQGKITFNAGALNPEAPNAKKTKKQSLVILFARLLISSLFLYIGIVEIIRQLRTVGHWYSMTGQGRVLNRPEGDGHDQIFFKLVQLLLCAPIAAGYQSKIFPVLLSTALILEAFIQWNFIGVVIPHWTYYPVHARDHFFTNLGVAGGLLLLSDVGSGAYSLDSWLKKRE